MRLMIACCGLAWASGCTALLGIDAPAGGDDDVTIDGAPGADGDAGPLGGCVAQPSWGTSMSYGVAAAPVWLEVGDLDHNGTPDVVVAGMNEFTIYRNLGGGTFGNPLHLMTPGSTCRNAVIVDFDGDGYNDLLVDTGGQLETRRQDPTSAGQFLAPQPVAGASSPLPMYRRGLALGDLNQDGHADVLTANGNDQVSVSFQVPATGTFTAGPKFTISSSLPAVWVAVGIADLSGDGVNDLVYISSTGVTLLPQNQAAAGTFGAPVLVGPSGAWAFALGDLDGDSRSDVIVSSSTATTLLHQDAPGILGAPVTVQGAPASKFGLYMVDANGDGAQDVVADGTVLFQCTTAGAPPYQAGVATFPDDGAVHFVDVDADGKPDVLYLQATLGLFTVQLRQ